VLVQPRVAPSDRGVQVDRPTCGTIVRMCKHAGSRGAHGTRARGDVAGLHAGCPRHSRCGSSPPAPSRGCLCISTSDVQELARADASSNSCSTWSASEIAVVRLTRLPPIALASGTLRCLPHRSRVCRAALGSLHVDQQNRFALGARPVAWVLSSRIATAEKIRDLFGSHKITHSCSEWLVGGDRALRCKKEFAT
jgi:hypothetical protein